MLGETSFTVTQDGEVLQSVAYTYDDRNQMAVTGTENYTVSCAYDANNIRCCSAVCFPL